MVLLRRLSPIAEVLLFLLDLVRCILPEAELILALPGTEAITILNNLTLVIVGLVHMILLFDRGNYSLELLGGEVEIAGDHFCHGVVTT